MLSLFRRPSVTVLSIDGGGIRGLIAASVLQELETILRQNGVNTPLGNLFDLIAGSSTGAIVGLGLAMPSRSGISFLQGQKPTDDEADMNMTRVCEIYRRLGSTIFPPDRFFSLRTVRQAFAEKYNAQPFERLLHAVFGDATLQDCRTNVLVTSYDTVRRSPHIFKFRRDRPQGDPNFYLRDVARATAAAPTFFKPALIRNIAHNPTDPTQEYCLIDGAIYANNPAMAAYIEARKIFPKAKRFTILSLGSGKLHGAYEYSDIQSWGYMDWVSPMRNVPLFTITNDAQTSMADYQLSKLPGVEYYRINLELSDGISEDMDNSSSENIAAIEKFAHDVTAAHKTSLHTIARLLMKRR